MTIVEGPTDPSDPHIVGVQLIEPSEQALVQTEDVANLLSGSDPVLGREAENGEVVDFSCDAQSNHSGQVLLAGGVPSGARKTLALSPTPISVHDACHVHEESR
jgi:hypothetical protein